MAKSREAFRTISEVSDLLETPAHVLRFWESRFSQIKPVKRAGGRRYYRPSDLQLLAGIRQLLHDDGLTIKGVQKILREKGLKHVSGLADLALEDDAGSDEALAETKAEPSVSKAAIPDEKPVRWIDPLPEETADEPEHADDITVYEQDLADTSRPKPVEEPKRQFGFVPNSIARTSTPLVKDEETAPEPADRLIRREADKASGSGLTERDILVKEIDDDASQERITALYARLKTLRDRVKSAMLEG